MKDGFRGKRIAILLALLLVWSCFFLVSAQAAKNPLDEIQEYLITVDTLPNGDAEITYHIVWKVLDSDSKGPLEYLFVGIPNKHVTNIKPLTENIKEIQYSAKSDDGSGSFVRIDFYRSYYKDEVFEFDFSIEQGYLYTLNKDETVTFGFTPGWFPNIAIKHMELRWNSMYVVAGSVDAPINENGQYVWQTSLEAGASEKLSVTVSYPQNRFEELDPNKQASNASGLSAVTIVFLVVVLVVVMLCVMAFLDGEGYGGGGIFMSSGGRGGGGGFSCACACACAGGGRAGCSAKNIYGAGLDPKELIAATYRFEQNSSKK